MDLDRETRCGERRGIPSCAPFAAAQGKRVTAFRILGNGWKDGVGMSAFEEHQEELERYEQMFGKERGRLAVSLDRITNALVLTGQHGVYCTSQRNPTVPAMDLRMIAQELTHAKELIQSVMEEMRKAQGSRRHEKKDKD